MGKLCVIFDQSLPVVALNAHKFTFLCKSAHKLTTDFDGIYGIILDFFYHEGREIHEGGALRPPAELGANRYGSASIAGRFLRILDTADWILFRVKLR